MAIGVSAQLVASSPGALEAHSTFRMKHPWKLAAFEMTFLKDISVVGRSAQRTEGGIVLGQIYLRCTFGHAGRRARKREGDGATPIGTWQIVEVLYRADRVVRPLTALPVRPLKRDSGWCDATGDRNYNRMVHHPYAASAERMWRDDPLYDLVAVLNHNRKPRVQGGGSAIFMHIARAGHFPTEGCIALRERDLRQVLSRASAKTRLHVFA